MGLRSGERNRLSARGLSGQVKPESQRKRARFRSRCQRGSACATAETGGPATIGARRGRSALMQGPGRPISAPVPKGRAKSATAAAGLKTVAARLMRRIEYPNMFCGPERASKKSVTKRLTPRPGGAIQPLPDAGAASAAPRVTVLGQSEQASRRDARAAVVRPFGVRVDRRSGCILAQATVLQDGPAGAGLRRACGCRRRHLRRAAGSGRSVRCGRFRSGTGGRVGRAVGP